MDGFPDADEKEAKSGKPRFAHRKKMGYGHANKPDAGHTEVVPHVGEGKRCFERA